MRGGFSLVELSIVLVILGLLVGGILSGQSLIRASELRSVISEQQRYITAMNTFRDKYFTLPGDFSKASQIWNPATTNGDENGAVQNHLGIGQNEISAFWVHLTSAGLLEGTYTQVAGTSMIPGTNNPQSKLPKGAWNIMHLGAVADDGSGLTIPDQGQSSNLIPSSNFFYGGDYGHVLLLGGGNNALQPDGVLKSEEAWNIDTKIDDGKPDRGAMTVLESQGAVTAGTGCGNQNASDAPLVVEYDLANPSRSACTLILKTGF